MSPSVPGLLAWAGLAAALILTGRFLARPFFRPEDGAAYRVMLSFLAGCLACHFLVAGLDFAGIPWHPWILATGIALIAAAAWRWIPKAGERTRLPSNAGWGGWGDGLAWVAWLTFTLFAASLWITLPDFIYHWGVKGARFALVRGIDYEYLARAWNWVTHPDYPNLLPELYAASSLLAGRFDPPALMLWTSLWFAGVLVSARETLGRLLTETGDRFNRQAALAAVGLSAAAFGIGHIEAGGADWMITLALAAAMPPLLAPVSRETDFQIGLIAAFSCASKVEGVPLAAFLIGIQLLRRVSFRSPKTLWPGWWSLARLALLPAAVVIPWLAAVRFHHLFQEFNAGVFDWSKAAIIGPALLSSMRIEPWHGFPFLLPALLPLLWVDRRLRGVAAVVSLQLAFYMYVYFTARVGTQFLVESSFPRLVLHLLPAVLAGAAGAAGFRSRR